jgi:hypothetical protein
MSLFLMPSLCYHFLKNNNNSKCKTKILKKICGLWSISLYLCINVILWYLNIILHDIQILQEETNRNNF